MTAPKPVFRLFSRLPTELRLTIWRYCLPNRIYEIDHPWDRMVFDLDDDDSSPSPCRLYQTTHQNGRPPLISRVCRESRAVAHEYGSFNTVCDPDRPLSAQWISGTDNSGCWLDGTRDSPHLNWTPQYEADYDYDGDSLQCLVWDALQLSATPSLMLTYFQRSRSEIDHGMEAYKQLSKWLIVMRVVVVHSDHELAAVSGLFGLLGDAQVQIVSVSEQAKLDRLYDLAEDCESKQSVTVTQNLVRPSLDSLEEELRTVLIRKFGSEDLAAIMHPAVMFRLCTEMCNSGTEVRRFNSLECFSE